MIFGAILAGGTGSRMNIADMPKQFLPLGDKPIILHTLEKFLLCDKMDRVYVGVHPDWVGHMQDLLERQVPQRERVILVPGGGDRNSTIFNIVDKIEADWGQSDDHLIITHDAVRPFVTLRILEENIEAARAFGACDTVVSAVDTIVVSENGETISQIPDRRLMYQGQTPQSFRISLLKKLYQSLDEEEKAVLTDACKICVVRQTPVRLVEGDVSNLKITTVSDYKIAQAMVGGQVVD
ncbi:2-C-methyl-D-erythritol 4-phosphate cytidylyltransferase [Bittarella massiliensis]|uniref:IspD/TarI family cytidylyltransferase n=1 Tax=Bittarella massiliensis (ex Durand et al. 2017) TaxID=1720313 RepID=UPI00163D2310|nr:2-C-methyl-D-erythritol 4-phosphate cytidylyltransferase [Bittarella massiliensis (ex Durand et al. 2017)]MBC2870946.1 2-C-methyl-D-erythritol 4-phosphate cytidylyltransferase [Bittarella massiliensis (ex Durand et al. 2017)]